MLRRNLIMIIIIIKDEIKVNLCKYLRKAVMMPFASALGAYVNANRYPNTYS
jgi:hypothetical protein